MSVFLTVNGTTYQYPEQGDADWGDAATAWANAVTTGMLQKAGGSFILTSEVDFGTLYGLMSIYYKARTPNPSSTGTLRLGYQNTIAWRNNANNGDLALAINGSDQLTFNGVAVQVGPMVVSDTATIDLSLAGKALSADIKLDSITNAMINSAAAIAYSKLNLSGSIVNADINASAAIALTKLATVTASRALQSSVSGAIEPSSVTSTELGYVSGVTSSIQNQLNGKQATGNYITALTGDVAASGPGSAAATIQPGVIVNSMVNASAAIARSKLATLTASRAMVTDGSGNDSVSAVTSTELGYVSGVTSAIQTQLSGKIDKSTMTTAGDMLYASGASTPDRLPIGSPGQVLKVNNSNVPSWSTITSDGTNYITNPNAEIGSTTGWALYNDSAASPVDGIGGTVSNMTYTVSTSQPLRDTSSFVLAKTGAVNIQGQGLSTDFTINNADKSKMLDVEFDYQTISGIFAVGALKVFIYDVTNASFIAINGSIESSDAILKFKSQFQSSYNSTSYRLIIHVTSSSILPWNLKLDGFRVSPSEYSYIAPITDERSYFPTVQGLGTLAASNVNWSQMGDKLYLRGRVTIGTPTAVEARIYLPNTSMIVDDVKITAIQIVGDVTRNTATSAGDWYLLAEPGVNYLTVGILNPGSGGLAKQNGTSFSTGDVVSFNAIVPIKGFSSGLKSSTDAGTRPCFAMYRLASAALTGNQPINYATLVADSHGAVTTGASWKFIAPFADFYEVTAQGAVGTDHVVYTVYKNGTFYSEIAYTLGTAGTGHLANGSVLVPMNAGDYVDVRPHKNTTSTSSIISGSSLGSTNYVFIRNVRAQQVIAASESVSCSVYLNANAAVAANGIIVYNSKEYDSHGAFDTSTGTFTAPQSAEYELTSYISNTTTSNMIVQIWKNGANYKPLTIVDANGYGQGTARIKLLAGETITIRSQTAVSYSGSASLSAGPTSLQITKTGNY